MLNKTSRLMAFAIGLLLFSSPIFGSFPNVSLLIKMTQSPKPGEIFKVDILIQKGNLQGISKFEIFAPYGTKVNVLNSQGSSFVRTKNGGKFIWMELPPKDEFNLSYELTIPVHYTGEYDITGGFFYLEEGDRKSILYHSVVDIVNNRDPFNISNEEVTLSTVDMLLQEKNQVNLYFSVQVGSYSNALTKTQKQLKYHKYDLIEMGYKENHIYLIGHFDKLNNAVEFRDNLPYKSAFIVPIYKGKRITVYDALKKLMM